jgi:hypothetical protein
LQLKRLLQLQQVYDNGVLGYKNDISSEGEERAMTTQHIELDPWEIVEDRPFTDPDNSLVDLTRLHYILTKLQSLLTQPDALPGHPRPLILHLSEPGERHLRLILCQLEALLKTQDLVVVGFCGHKAPEADRSLLDMVDSELVAEMLEHPHLLCYGSLELEGGDWCNLVLFDHIRGLAHWTRSGRHGYAAIQLAPQYYRSIRLHNALLPGGVMAGQGLNLLRTKYYDYRGGSIWWAVRELPTH